jgi:DNA-binding CsgD family transcriptional regulator
MKKTVLVYSAAVAAGAFLLQWLEYQYTVRLFSTEIYVAVVALGFAALGAWVGHRIFAPAPRPDEERNRRAIEHLGITARECEVLDLLARGHSNREIAERLFVSPNTVKTHLASLYGKLEVSRRTQAIDKARSLRMIS